MRQKKKNSELTFMKQSVPVLSLPEITHLSPFKDITGSAFSS